MKKLLLTAFEPFNGQIINPSLEAARAMKTAHFSGAQIEVLELPVHRFEAIETTLSYLHQYQPDIVIMLGEAGGREGVTPERIAFNLDDFPIPDNGGHQPRNEIIALGGSESYFSTLPIEEIEKRLHLAQFPSSISESAGRYLCNRLFYSVMHAVAVSGGPSSAGFVHLPYLREQVMDLAVETPSFTREELVQAVQLVIEVCLDKHYQA